MFFLIIEILVILLFIIFLFIFKEKFIKKILFYSVIFAFVFELFGVLFGGYVYNPGFLITIFKIPIFIILSWGLIITTSYLLIKKLTNHKLTVAVLVTLSVLAIDLFFEIISVHLNFWTWNNNVVNAYLNVDPSNFIGWMLVTFCFIYFYEKKPIYSIFFGFVSYLILGFILFKVFSLIQNINLYLPAIIIFSFFVTFGFILFNKYKKKEKFIFKNNQKEIVLLYLFRLPYILVGIIGFFIYKLYNFNFAIILISIGVLIEIIFYYLLNK